jgi:hypothetical protein
MFSVLSWKMYVMKIWSKKLSYSFRALLINLRNLTKFAQFVQSPIVL